MKKYLSSGLLIGAAILTIFYGLICLSIGRGVRSISKEALREYPGNEVKALISFVNSQNQSLGKRNRAVWALGQIGDKQALPTLEKFYTGQPCDHEKYLCQKELKKAIRLCKGGFNLTRWAWRRFISF